MNLFDILEKLIDSLLDKALPGAESAKGRVSKSAARRKQLSSSAVQQIKQQWLQIDQLKKLGSPAQLKQAVIEADKLLDHVLKMLVPGETMGERLKAAKPYFTDYQIYDQLWKAHKMRNSLVHESNFQPTHTVLHSTIDKYKNALDQLL